MERSAWVPAFAVMFGIVLTAGGPGQSTSQSLQKAGLSAEARAAILTVGDDVRKLEKSHQGYVKAAGGLDGLYTKLLQKVREVSRLAAEAEKAKSANPEKLYAAVREMAEMSQGFNMQYLQLQQAMQDENRRFTLVSNIMKTKHDTAKSAINNIR